MAGETIGLSLGVDVSQVDNATKSLKNFQQANEQAAQGVTDFGNAEYAARVRAKDMARELATQRKEFDKLESAIDPIAGKLKSLGQQASQLDSLWSKGIVPDETFYRLSEVIESQSNALKVNQQALTAEGRAALEESASKSKAAAAGRSFLASLQSQADSLGKSKEELLEMKAAQLGVSASAAPLIEQMKQQAEATRVAAEASKQKAQADREAAAAQKAGTSFISSLKSQAESIGKTRSELLEMKAAQLGVSESAAPFIASLKQQEQALSGNAKQMKMAGLSAGQYKNAMRLLPAQITDVVTSLASGMPVWLVAIQQGGQIKDSFGGIGNTFKILAGYISPMVVGATALVGALGGMAIAAYSAQKANSELANALILTGNYAASSSGEIVKMNAEISQSSLATIGTIQGISTELVKSGKYTQQQIALITAVTANWSTVTGDSAESIIKYFDQIAKDPVKGLAALNDQFNFLDKGQLTYIDKLEKTKGTTEAATAATKIFADVMEKRIAKMAENATPLEKMWTDIKKWSSDAWSEVSQGFLAGTNLIIDVVTLCVQQIKLVLGQGDQIIAEFIQATASKLAKIPGAGDYFQGMADDQKKFVDDTKKQNADLLKNISETQSRIAKGEAGYRKSAQSDSGSGNQYKQSTKDAVDKENEALQKKAKTQKVTVDQGDKILDQYNADIVALQSQLKVLTQHTSVNDTISQQRKTLWNEQARIQVLEQAQQTRSLTKDEKSVLANKDKILALAEQKAVIGDQIVLQEQLNKRQDESVKFIQQMASQTAALNATAALGDREQERANARAKMESDWTAKGGSVTDSQYVAMTQASDAYYAAEDAKRANWEAGAENAFKNYGDQATNMYANIGSVATTALNGLTDQMTDLLTTGKANFADFAKSIISMIVKMILQMVIFNTLAAAFGGGSSSSSSSNSFSSGSYSNLGFATGGFTGNGGKYEPKGVVHGGEFVFTKEATRRLGVGNLYKLMRGYANGGVVGSNMGSGTASSNSGSAFSFGDINVDVNNGNDPKGLEAGVKAIFTDMITKSCSQGGEVYKFVRSKG